MRPHNFQLDRVPGEAMVESVENELEHVQQNQIQDV